MELTENAQSLSDLSKTDSNQVANTAPAAGIDSNPVQPAPVAQTSEKAAPAPAPEAEPAQGFFGKLLKHVSGDAPACTCGKPKGQWGRHKGHCAIERAKRPAPSTFDAPDLSAANAPAAAAAPLVPFQQPVAPKNHSFYGRAGETFLRARLRVEQWRQRRKASPVLGENEAADIAKEFDIPEEDLKDFKEAMIEWAKHDDWPEAHPGVRAAMIYGNIELHFFLSSLRVDTRLKKIQQALERANELKANEQKQGDRNGNE